MNYYGPRQVEPGADRPDAGLWRYTCRNDDRIWEVGYCGPTRDCQTCHGRTFVTHEPCAECGGKGYVTVERCPGHPTADEACAHYRLYVLDCLIGYDMRSDPAIQHRCEAEGCDAWTQTAATERPLGRHWWLCDEHRNRQTVERLYGDVGTSVSSY